jgi:hypothetical protein
LKLRLINLYEGIIVSNITINSLPTASTIDGSADILPIYTASATATQGINRNTLLGLSSAPVGLTDSQTLTNKILTSPTINGATLLGTLSGTYTIGGTPTFPSSVVTLTGLQTLTNKVLTSPTITSPTITNATLSSDTITGFTSANNGTIYGMSITGSVFTSAVVGTSSIATNAVQASNLATNAITLGYAQVTASLATTSTTPVQATGLTATVTIPAGGRRIKITAYGPGISNNNSTFINQISIWDGTVGSGTQLQLASIWTITANDQAPALVFAVVTPATGNKTYNVGLAALTGGTTTLSAGSTSPAFILVEAI